MAKIKIISREIETKKGKTFTAYKAVKNDGKLIDCKFRKNALDNLEAYKELPKGKFFIDVDKQYINFAHGEYPCIWIHSVNDIQEIKNTEDAIIEEMFDIE